MSAVYLDFFLQKIFKREKYHKTWMQELLPRAKNLYFHFFKIIYNRGQDTNKVTGRQDHCNKSTGNKSIQSSISEVLDILSPRN